MPLGDIILFFIIFWQGVMAFIRFRRRALGNMVNNGLPICRFYWGLIHESRKFSVLLLNGKTLFCPIGISNECGRRDNRALEFENDSLFFH